MGARGWTLVLAGAAASCGFRVVPPEPACFVYAVASDGHTCGRKSDGTLWCWGANQHGELGTGDTTGRAWPERVDGAALTRTVGGIYVPTGAAVVTSRTSFTCAKRTEGTLWCWGDNEYGQLGTGDTEDHVLPVQVDPERLGAQVHAASLGSGFACARKNDNTIWCWGANESGQLGTGDTDPRLRPAQVDPEGLGAGTRYLATGSAHTCARKTDGTLWCWGANESGQLGTGDTERRLVPVQVDPGGLGNSVSTVFAGASHTCATRTDNTLWCWGANQYGQLGTGTFERSLVPVKVELSGLGDGVSLVTAGGNHSCAVKADGSMWCWGANRAGQLGNVRFENSTVPSPVYQGDFRAGVAQVYAGGLHTCARLQDASVWCWGSNELGQLGIGPGPGVEYPVEVSPSCP